MSYGGALDLWGQTWTTSDVNAANFGAALAVRMQHGSPQVDHMRMTVFWASTLPVELFAFTATHHHHQVRLDRATGTETNNDRFVIERSTTGLEFQGIGAVPGAGTSQTASFYTFVDEDPLEGTSYYRLKQVDMDGPFDHSDVVAVDRRISHVDVYANPTPDGHLFLGGQMQGLNEVSVHRLDMRLVKVERMVTGQPPTIHIGDQPDGSYLLLLRGSSGTRAVRVAKESRSF